MKNLMTAVMLAGIATVAALPQQPPPTATDATTVLQPIGNGFVGGVSVPAGTAAGTAGTNLAPALTGNGLANPGLGNSALGNGAGNNALTNGGGTAFNAGNGIAGGLGASVQQQLAQQQQAALSGGGGGGVAGAAVPGQVDLANNAFAGGRVGAAGPGVILPLGRSQVLPNQKFIVNSRMMIQVADGALLCDAGGNVGLNGLQQQGQQEFVLRQGQMYRFRGAGVGGGPPGLNQGFGVEACIAERPSIVLAEPY